MDSCSTIVIHCTHVHSGKVKSSHGSNVSRGCGKQEIDDIESLGFVAVSAGIYLVGSVAEIVILMEIEYFNEFLFNQNHHLIFLII